MKLYFRSYFNSAWLWLYLSRAFKFCYWYFRCVEMNLQPIGWVLSLIHKQLLKVCERLRISYIVVGVVMIEIKDLVHQINCVFYISKSSNGVACYTVKRASTNINSSRWRGCSSLTQTILKVIVFRLCLFVKRNVLTF